MEKTYDYIIVGSGLFGSVFAREMRRRGKRLLVLERREEIGGNIYTERVEGIPIFFIRTSGRFGTMWID